MSMISQQSCMTEAPTRQDYYAKDMKSEPEDPADPEQPVRVLTIMRADEY